MKMEDIIMKDIGVEVITYERFVEEVKKLIKGQEEYIDTYGGPEWEGTTDRKLVPYRNALSFNRRLLKRAEREKNERTFYIRDGTPCMIPIPPEDVVIFMENERKKKMAYVC